MHNTLIRKGLFLAIIVCFVGACVFPSISGNFELKEEIYNENTASSKGNVDWWPMFHHDLSHSGNSTSDAPDTNKVLWDYTTSYRVYSSPAVSDGKVYIGSGKDTGLGGKVYCLNADNGNKIWSYTTGGSVGSSPAVADGKVYVGCNYGKVYCLNADNGSMIWSYTTGNDVFSSPAVADGKVYIGSRDGNVYCFSDSGTHPPNEPTIDGPNSGKAGTSYTYTFTSSDPDGDDVSYYIEWSDVSTTTWTTFQPSGSPGYSESHTWRMKGDYTIRAQVMDVFGVKSGWATLTVSMPKNKMASYNSLSLRFLERFPILQKLLILIN